MLVTLKEIGDLLTERRGLSEPDKCVESAVLEKAEKVKVLCIRFEKKEGRIVYHGVHPESYDSYKSTRYLYRSGSSRGTDITPTARITNLEGTFNRKIMAWFENYKGSDPLIVSLKGEIMENREKILGDLNDAYDSVKGEQVLLTLKIRENGKENYLGDYDGFRKILIEKSKERFYVRESMGESKGTGTCYICGEEGEMCGFGLPRKFSFFTVDKKGYAPSFRQEDSWKRLPLCSKCATSLWVGKEFLEKYLSFKFHGYRYYVVPEFVFESIGDEIIGEIEDYEGQTYEEGLLNDEDYFLDIARKRGDVLSLNFLFYKAKGGGKYMDIVKQADSVPPSWINKIYEAIDKTKELSIFEEDAVKKILGEKRRGEWRDNNIGKLVYPFFPLKHEEIGTSDKYFLDVVGNILTESRIDYDFLINSFMRKMRFHHRKKQAMGAKDAALHSLFFFCVLSKLNLIER